MGPSVSAERVNAFVSILTSLGFRSIVLMWRSGLEDLSGVSTMHGFFSKHQSFSLALARFHELGNVT